MTQFHRSALFIAASLLLIGAPARAQPIYGGMHGGGYWGGGGGGAGSTVQGSEMQGMGVLAASPAATTCRLRRPT